jgi:feruloyl esterase
MQLRIAAALVAIAGSRASASTAGSCPELARLALPNTRITLAQVVPAGNFPIPAAATVSRFPPQLAVARQAVQNLPAFCRVTAEINPVEDSDIQIEVWMPVTGWNRKLVGVGNGAFAGGIRYDELGPALRQGYAVASNNTGHDGGGADASFGLGHPEKVIDYGYRAAHEMTVKARALVEAFYGRPAERAYWDGCSAGGRQGLMEAQRFPDDYDAIVAGAPATNHTQVMVAEAWAGRATHSTPASYIPRALYAVIHKAALDACDAQDGLKDGLIDDPRYCHFDPGVLLCPAGESAGCLTAAQVEAVRRIYAGPTNPRTGEQISPGLEPGSEMLWSRDAGTPPAPIAVSAFKYLVFGDTTWDLRSLDFDRDVALADRLLGRVVNATDPNLEPFIGRGGKLLLYHGWSDQAIPPLSTVDYYERVVKAVSSARARDAVRLFMVPGMQHCVGGDGPDHFDALAALDSWVETGKAPERIVAAKVVAGRTVRTRPLCPFPQVARYTGTGSIDDAANFLCAAPTIR